VSQNFIHKPVMLQEVVGWSNLRDGSISVDGTIGSGGHAAALLAASSPSGKLFGCDRDGDELEAAGRRLAEFAGRFELRRGNYAELRQWIEPGTADLVLLDLGMSSPQLDRPERGFSFKSGPLDMRMDTRQTLTAAALVNEAGAEELAKIFWEFGGERDARRFARAIVKDREQRRFTTTDQLAELIERLSPRGKKTHPATRVFQALRIAVNSEVSSLKAGLAGAIEILKRGGRLAVISFHSLEDKIVKEATRERARDYTFEGDVDVPELRKPQAPDIEILTRKAIKPGEKEVTENPRARSAQLRVFEKL